MAARSRLVDGLVPSVWVRDGTSQMSRSGSNSNATSLPTHRGKSVHIESQIISTGNFYSRLASSRRNQHRRGGNEEAIEGNGERRRRRRRCPGGRQRPYGQRIA